MVAALRGSSSGMCCLDLADQVGADVGGLGEDAAADTHEHGQQRGAEAEALEHLGRLALVDQHHERRAEQAQADGEHAGHAAGPEGDAHRLLLAGVPRRRRDAHVAADGQPHAEVAGRGGEHRADQEEQGAPDPLGGGRRRAAGRAGRRPGRRRRSGCGTAGSGRPRRPPGWRAAISCIFAVPAGAASTSRDRIHATPRAASPMAATTPTVSMSVGVQGDVAISVRMCRLLAWVGHGPESGPHVWRTPGRLSHRSGQHRCAAV